MERQQMQTVVKHGHQLRLSREPLQALAPFEGISREGFPLPVRDELLG